MKTVFINGSPKKRFCASSYFLFLQRLFVGGEKVTETLRTPADHDRVLEQPRDAQAVVFGVPLIEGKQNEALMRVFENFCIRAGLTWGGGVGIGGGVMLNVTRILFLVDIALLALNTVLSAVNSGNFFPKEAWISFGENAALLLFFNLGALFFLARMGRHIRRAGFSGKKYTRILIPSFIFIAFADIFFLIISIFEGGIFRGWLARKQ